MAEIESQGGRASTQDSTPPGHPYGLLILLPHSQLQVHATYLDKCFLASLFKIEQPTIRYPYPYFVLPHDTTV